MKNSSTLISRCRLYAVITVLTSTMIAGCAAPITRTVWVYDQPANATVRAPLASYGTVASIKVIDTQVGVTGAGAATGAVLGGALTSGLGHGRPGRGGPGFFPFAVIGIVAGALIGNHAEQQQARAASSRQYQVVIDFDNGSTRSYDVSDLNGLHSGERVKLERGEISPGG